MINVPSHHRAPTIKAKLPPQKPELISCHLQKKCRGDPCGRPANPHCGRRPGDGLALLTMPHPSTEPRPSAIILELILSLTFCNLSAIYSSVCISYLYTRAYSFTCIMQSICYVMLAERPSIQHAASNIHFCELLHTPTVSSFTVKTWIIRYTSL